MFSRGQALVSQSKDEVFDALIQACKEVKAKIKDADKTRHIIIGKSANTLSRLSFDFRILINSSNQDTMIEIYDYSPGLMHPDARFIDPLLKSLAQFIPLKTGYTVDRVKQITSYEMSADTADVSASKLRLLEHCEHNIELVEHVDVPEVKGAHKLIINPSELEYTLEFEKEGFRLAINNPIKRY